MVYLSLSMLACASIIVMLYVSMHLTLPDHGCFEALSLSTLIPKLLPLRAMGMGIASC